MWGNAICKLQLTFWLFSSCLGEYEDHNYRGGEFERLTSWQGAGC